MIAGLLAAEAGLFIWKTEPFGVPARAAVQAMSVQQKGMTPLNEGMFSEGFDKNFKPASPSTISDAPAPDTTVRFLAAEKAWQTGRFAEASRRWRVLAEEAKDLHVADWAAKAAARSDDVRLMAQAGATWQALAGGEHPHRYPLGPRPGLAFFASLLQKDGYLARTYAPSGEQGAQGPALMEEAYTQWVNERAVGSHPFLLDAATQQRLDQPRPLTGDAVLDTWLNQLPESRSTVLAEFLAHSEGTWSTQLHDKLWAEEGPLADASQQRAEVAIKTYFSREAKMTPDAGREAGEQAPGDTVRRRPKM